MVVIANNDSHMIDRDGVIVQLCRLMTQRQPIRINLNGEGPCAASLGLYDLLDRLCAEFDYDPTLVSVETCNLAERHDRYHVVIRPQTMYLFAARQHAQHLPRPTKTFDLTFRHFGHFIGHGNLQRLHMASQLHLRHANKLLQSYHYRRGDEYHEPFVGIEDMLFGDYSWPEIECAFEFIHQCPLTLDQIDQYPILNPTTLNITKIYPEFFLEVVNLTYFSGRTFYIDEKIWRPMLMRTPFMVQGPQNFLKNLRSIGFRTFDQWWDEGYSEDPGRCQNDGILRNLQELAHMSVTQLQKLYDDMRPVLDHNHDLMMSIQLEEMAHA